MWSLLTLVFFLIVSNIPFVSCKIVQLKTVIIYEFSHKKVIEGKEFALQTMIQLIVGFRHATIHKVINTCN